MSVLMRRENTLIIEPGSDISKIQIINFILLPNSKKHFEGPPLQLEYSYFRKMELDRQNNFIEDLNNKLKYDQNFKNYTSLSQIILLLICLICVWSYAINQYKTESIFTQRLVIIFRFFALITLILNLITQYVILSDKGNKIMEKAFDIFNAQVIIQVKQNNYVQFNIDKYSYKFQNQTMQEQYDKFINQQINIDAYQSFVNMSQDELQKQVSQVQLRSTVLTIFVIIFFGIIVIVPIIVAKSEYNLAYDIRIKIRFLLKILEFRAKPDLLKQLMEAAQEINM
ncbi:Hypothetical_protein [Hexamita inflata]|uniref:Hypothetical_protein n=1 Tax=Hexamita inflata TaxID=28002 RepID=A0AA86PA76_9EUKA|nr:Hypothetical protein HINF_LOCUS22363 [Hexamita inflata]